MGWGSNPTKHPLQLEQDRMQLPKTLTRWLPYGVALVVFLVINLCYFAPQFQGEVLPQHDIMQYKGMTQDIEEHRAQYGEDPQWEGRMFSGMPAYLINVKYDGTLIRSLTKAFYFLGQPAALIFLSMVFFFCMLLCLGINPWIGLIPSLAYGLSTYFFIIIGAGHMTKMMALAFAPMMLGGVFYAYRRNAWIGAALTGFFGSILIGVNHPQITYYFLLIVLAYWINELIRAYKAHTLNRFAKTTGLLALAAVLAVGSNAGMLYYIQSHSPETIRGGSELTTASSMEGKDGLDLEYATNWSYGKTETFNLLIPNLFGGTSEGGFSDDGPVAKALTPYNARGMATQLPAYWGDQPITSGPVYIGAVILFIAVLGLFVLRGSTRWWIAIITLLAVLLAWGRNFMWFTELFFNYFPMYNKFRTVSMILVIVEWTVPLLGALTLQQIWTQALPPERLRRGLKYTTGIVGGIALFFLLFGGTLFSFASPVDAQMPQDVASAMQQERASMLRADALRSLIFVLLSAGVLWLFIAQKLKKRGFILLLCALVIADMVPVNLRYLNPDKFVPEAQNQLKPTAADQQILADKEPGFRVLNLSVSPFQDATTSYFHRSVGGYHGAKLRRYQDVIERHLSQMNWGVYNMLNTKYIITQDQQSGALQVQQNPGANGAAWFVDQIRTVQGADAEIAALDSLDTKRIAVVEQRFAPALEGLQLQADSTAQITLTDYRVNRLTYDYTAAHPGVAVFSEIYYPKGWTAYLDGKEAPYFRADYLLRAMVLPAGHHQVEFVFRAPHYNTLSAIAWVCSLLLLGAVVAVVIYAILKKQRHDGQ